MAHLVAIGVHGHQAEQVVHVAAAAQTAHKLGPHTLVPEHTLITRCCDQPLHADGTVLEGQGETLRRGVMRKVTERRLGWGDG